MESQGEKDIDDSIESLLQAEDLQELLGTETITETISSVRMLKTLQKTDTKSGPNSPRSPKSEVGGGFGVLGIECASAAPARPSTPPTRSPRALTTSVTQGSTSSGSGVEYDSTFVPRSMSETFLSVPESLGEEVDSNDGQDKPTVLRKDLQSDNQQTYTEQMPARRVTSPHQTPIPVALPVRGNTLAGLPQYDDGADSVEKALAWDQECVTTPLSPAAPQRKPVSGLNSSRPFRKRSVPEGVDMAEVVAQTQENIRMLRKEIEELTLELMNSKRASASGKQTQRDGESEVQLTQMAVGEA